MRQTVLVTGASVDDLLAHPRQGSALAIAVVTLLNGIGEDVLTHVTWSLEKEPTSTVRTTTRCLVMSFPPPFIDRSSLHSPG